MSDYQRQDGPGRALQVEERSPREIERQIERTRARMSDNLDALGDRLRPERLKRQAKDALAGKVQDLVANVGDQARQTGTRVTRLVRGNPLPAVAATLGAVWLLALRKRGRRKASSLGRKLGRTEALRRPGRGARKLSKRLAG